MSEQWKPIVGYEGFYEVSDLGRIRAFFDSGNRRHNGERHLKSFLGKNGYLHVRLCPPGQKAKTKTIHSLVLSSFSRSRLPGEACRHLDGNKVNNCSSNLQWGTYSENESDKILHGTDGRGERNPSSKLSEADVISIRNSSLSRMALSKEYGVSYDMIWRIQTWKNWKHVVLH